MKKIISILLIALCLTPFGVLAAVGDGAGDEYKSLDLVEALDEEDIKLDFKNYKDSKDKATIYLFRGRGCSFCRSFLTFLNSIVNEYGDKFRVVSYEVWNDSKNSSLMDEVSNYLGEPAGGVPYIIIGEKVFPGYIPEFDEDIIKAIEELYSSKNRYDVFENMHNGVPGKEVSNTDTNVDSESSDDSVNFNNKTSSLVEESKNHDLLWNALFILGGTLIIVATNFCFYSKLNKKIDNLKTIEPKKDEPKVKKIKKNTK